MSGKLKALLAVLSLGAVASGVYLLSIIRDPKHVTALADPAVLQAQALGLLEAAGDTDGDGLTDSEETYWETDFRNKDTDGDGFLDGEEVLSGHDPAKPGPNDWLDNSKNITERMTDLMVGGIYSGDLKPDTPKYDESVQQLAESILEQYRENISIQVDDITLTKSDTLRDRHRYVFEMAWIMSAVLIPAIEDAQKFLETISDVPLDDASALADNPKRFTAFATATRRLAQSSGERAVRIAALPVPRSFSVQHHGAIRLMRGLQRQYELAATIKDDPIQGLVAIRAIVNLHTNTLPSFMGDFARKVELNLADD